MTREILEKYIKSLGLVLWKGGASSTQCFMPMMCFDCAYQIFSEDVWNHFTYIEKVSENEFKLRYQNGLKHKPKQWLNRVNDAFCDFFTQFIEPFDEDELDEINADMNKFREFTNNQIMCMRVAMANGLDYLPFEEQKLFSAVHTVNILSACAGVFWEDTFHTRSTSKGDRNKLIDAATAGTRNFARLYMGELDVPEAKYQEIENCKDVLFKKIVDFIKIHQKI